MKSKNRILSIIVMATMLMSVIPYAHATISIFVSQASGNPGTSVLGGGLVATNITITGNANRGDQVQATWDGQRFPTEAGCGRCNATGDSTHGFYTLWFLVPQATMGTHTITVTDITNPAGGSSSTQFTVQPIMELLQKSGFVGDQVTLVATGLATSTTTKARFQPTADDLGTFTTTNLGSLKKTVSIPDGISGGHTIELTDASGTLIAGARFNVGANISLIQPPANPTVGATLMIRGKGFSNIETLTVYFARDAHLSDGKTSVGVFTTNDRGTFPDAGPFSFTIPSMAQFGSPPASTFYLVAINDAHTHNGTLPVSLVPSLTLAPDHGAQGQQITATGAGFAAGKTVTLTVDGLTRNLATATTDSLGAFTTNFVITSQDSLPFGPHTVQAMDASGFGATATFRFGTQISITPRDGIAKSATDSAITGSTITVQGFVFTPNSAVIVKFDNAQVATATADKNGGFTTTFVVPGAVGGVGHAITASDSARPTARTAQASFEVIPWINIDSHGGNVGATATVTGTGFDASAPVNVHYCGLGPSPVLVAMPLGATQCAPANVFSSSTNDPRSATPDIWNVFTTGAANGVLGKTTTDANGAFSVQLTIPESYGGYHTLWAAEPPPIVSSTTTTAASWNNLLYQVIPTVTLTPTTAQQAKQIRVTASGEMAWEMFSVNGEQTAHMWNFVLDFGPDGAYLDVANTVLNGQFDQAWSATDYTPLAISQSGSVIYVNAMGFANQGSQFLKVPSLEPGPYTVNAMRVDPLDGTSVTDQSISFTIGSPEIAATNSARDTVNTHIDNAANGINAHTDNAVSGAVTNIRGKLDEVTGQLTKSIGDAKDAVLSLVGSKADAISALVNSKASDTVNQVNAHIDSQVNTAVSNINSNTKTQVDNAVTNVNGHVDQTAKSLNDTITSTTNSVESKISTATDSLTSAINSRASQSTVDSLSNSVTGLSGTANTTQNKVSDLQNGVSLTVQTPVGYAITILAALAAIGSLAAAVMVSRRLKVAT